ncbi:hypothetical protein KDL67_03425 [bacterium]|nr:hypothetical protein [bacterium]
MKTRILVALALIALALPAAAEPLELHVIALQEYGLAINAAEFGFDNLPFDQCYIEEEWDGDYVLGGIAEGWVAMAFSTPQSDPIVHLGLLRFTCLEPLGNDYEISVAPDINDLLEVWDTESQQEITASGGCFFFNPSDWGYDCYVYCTYSDPVSIGLFPTADALGPFCADLLPETTPADDSSWGSIKSLY